MLVYLLHFDRPLAHSQHYIGYTTEEAVEDRLLRHTSGRGARICAAATAAGINIQVARTWPNAKRFFERKLKARKNARKLCPICRSQQ